MSTTPDPTEGGAHVDSPTPRAKSRKGSRRRKKGVFRATSQVLGVMSLTLVLVLSLGSMYLYRKLEGNVTRSDATDRVTNRPENKKVAGEPIDILVMGVDTRELDASRTTELSDTTILLHLSADRKRAYGISIPRDSIVDRPECQRKGESSLPPAEDMWNAAYALAGPSCTLQQFESLTGVRTEHHMIVKFSGFRNMVEALDGVRMCIPETMTSSKLPGWVLEAGPDQLLEGEDALNYVRVRYGVGDGTDLSRTRRQQAFMAAMIKKVKSSGTLSNPKKVYSFLDAATSSLTSDMGVKDMAGLALEFKDIGLDDVQFLTIPNNMIPDGQTYGGKVRWSEDDAAEVWQAIAEDRPIPERFLGVMSSAKSGGKGGLATRQAASDDKGKKKGKKNKPSPTSSASPSEDGSTSPSDGASTEDYDVKDPYVDAYANPEFNGLCG